MEMRVGVEDIEAVRYGFLALRSGNPTSTLLTAALKTGPWAALGADVFVLLEGSLDLETAGSCRAIKGCRQLFRSSGFTVEGTVMLWSSPPAFSHFPGVMEDLLGALTGLEKAVERRDEVRAGKRSREELEPEKEPPEEPLETPAQLAARISGLMGIKLTPAELQRNVQLQEEARRVLATGAPGQAPLASEATGALPRGSWQSVDRSSIMRAQDLSGTLSIGPNGTLSVNRNKVPTLIQWRETNYMHLASLDGVLRENFQELVLMYERLLSNGHDFLKVYKFSLDAAEDCNKHPLVPFNSDILAARYLVSVMVPDSGNHTGGGYSGGGQKQLSNVPCPYFNLSKGRGKGCQYPSDCRMGPHRCTTCHKTSATKLCLTCNAPGRDGGGRGGGRGRGEGRGKGLGGRG